jgi:quinol monooxygenase YgiN
MIRRNLYMSLILSVILCQFTIAQSNTTRIRHMVVFKLKHPEGSAGEQNFLFAIRKLAEIPGVEKFECMRQISKKNKYAFGLSMEFANQQAYDQYNNNPEHVAFVQNRWLKEVDDFLEIDFKLLE